MIKTGGSSLKNLKPSMSCAVCILISACSGGGGGAGGSGGIAATPPPTNSSITNLVANQSFSGVAGATHVAFDLGTRTVSSSSTADQQLTISYDAAAKSYTLNQPGRTTSFQAADIQSNSNGETRFARGTGSTRDYLTIVTTPYSGSVSNRYVALGYAQHNETSTGVQNTDFAAFTFGLESPVSAIPRSGTASWQTDVFGLYDAPGQTPRTVQGAGDLTVNFAKGLFTTNTFLTQSDFLTGASLSGGGIALVGQGTLGSDGNFAGNVTYEGSLGTVAGPLNGRFYGPGAEEVGAAFHADNGSGITLNGALTGQRKAVATPTNFTLDSITSDQMLTSFWVRVDQNNAASGVQLVPFTSLFSQITLHPDGSFYLGTPVSDMPGATFTAADQLSTNRPDFVSYQKVVGGNPVRVDLYRPASGSQAVVLTYANFGAWSWTSPQQPYGYASTAYFTYGFLTPRDILSRRTGTASYDGPAYGSAVSTSARYMVSGNSHFDVDFGAQRFAGTLVLNGAPETGGSATALGTWQFGTTMAVGQLVQTALTNPAAAPHPSNQIVPQLYGPNGNEIAATFTIVTGAQINGQNVAIAGATVAKPR